MLDKYLFCVVRDPDTGEEQRSDNIPVRAEVTLSFEAVNGTATISYTRTNAAQPPVVINNGETKSQYFLTQDVLNMHLDPADGFLFYRQIAYLNTQNVWVPVRTLANADPDYPLTINTGSREKPGS